MGGRSTAIDIPMLKIGREYCKDGIFLCLPVIAETNDYSLDLYPLRHSMCVIYGNDVDIGSLILDDLAADKILRDLPKHLPTYEFMLPILGKTSLVTVYGEYWRKVRKMFNPAFATSHLETLIPGIIEESVQFNRVLESAARSGETLELGIRLPVESFNCC